MGHWAVLVRSWNLGPTRSCISSGNAIRQPSSYVCRFVRLKSTRDKMYQDLKETTKNFCLGLKETFETYSCKVSINYVCGMFSIFFGVDSAANFDEVNNSDTEKYSRFFYSMLNRGIYLAPSPYELAFLSTAHNQQILSETLKAVEDTLKKKEL